jgi:hypothetical protein
LPKYIAQQERGAGFAEVVRFLSLREWFASRPI